MKSNFVVFAAALAAFVGASAPVAIAQTPTAKTASVYCAVTNEKIGNPKQAYAKKIVGGKTYYLCCPGCAPAFTLAPGKYAKLADLRAERRTMEAKLAKVNAAIKEAESGVEGTLRDSDHGTSVVKPAAPVALHCAITGEAIASVKNAAGSQVYNGKTYYFCCPGCVAKFKADPAKYAEASIRVTAPVN